VTRKRSRQEDINTNADVNVRDNTLKTLQEGNSNGWIEEDESTDGGNCGKNGDNAEAAQKDSNLKNPVPTKSFGTDG
ncbi:predicted protein, partial [Arabidopsis lyrata subsp. lyrata]